MRTHTDRTKPDPSSIPRTGTPPPLPVHPVLQLQRAVGNQAVLRLQAKLAVNKPGGPDEQEADRVAAQVMRMPAMSAPGIQRSCDCGGGGGECPDCKAKAAEEVQRAAGPEAGEAAADVPPVVHDVLRSSGQPLDPAFRASFEPRFGQDFSGVRVHTGSQAATAAASIQAKAFTSGSSIVFGAGQYAPHHPQGQELLAHELTHVMQQGASAPAEQVQCKLVVEDPNVPLPGTPPAPAKESWEEIKDYVGALTASFEVKSTGEVEPKAAGTCAAAPATTTDTCFCDLHNSADPEPWKIKIDDADWPHTEEANRRVTVHSTRSAAQFGAWGGGAQAGKRIQQGNPRVLGHELCGHAHLMELGKHPSVPMVTKGGKLMGRPGHDETVKIENKVASEAFGAAAETRGSFADPHHGESFARFTVSAYPEGAVAVADLSGDMQARLDKVKFFMDSEPRVKADVIGHADQSGKTWANQSVSLRRAREVRDHLVKLGIDKKRFNDVLGKGAAECTSAGPDPACRKVDVFLYIFEAARETSK